MLDNNKVLECAELLQVHCASHRCCDDCILCNIEDYGCIIKQSLPDEWDIDKIKANLQKE